MPNIKSAKKRVKVIATKSLQKKAVKSQLRTEIKKANTAVADNSSDKAAAISLAIKKIDQATAKGVMHKNTASRKKSALAKKLNASA